MVLGGIHPSAMPAEAAQHADAVVIGEGELTLPRLLDDFKKGKLERFYRMPHMVDQWDHTPPRWDLLPKGYMFREALTATRGAIIGVHFVQSTSRWVAAGTAIAEKRRPRWSSSLNR